MNLVTASQMLTMLEASQHDGVSDDSYFIIQRLLRAELRKAHFSQVPMQRTFTEIDKPSPEEIQAWQSGNKVLAIKLYRERTRSGLYESKKAMEAYEAQWLQEQRDKHNAVGPEVTSCG